MKDPLSLAAVSNVQSKENDYILFWRYPNKANDFSLKFWEGHLRSGVFVYETIPKIEKRVSIQ